MEKVDKGFWEVIFKNPSFNIRFGCTLSLVLLVFALVGGFVLRKTTLIDGVGNQIEFINLLIQTATLVLGIFAAYYALRQLVETRFTGLDEAAMQEHRRQRYNRAFNKWREAFYIRPESSVFTNLCESLLLFGDYETFDKYMTLLDEDSSLQKNILEENSDKIILLHLKSIRNLLVKNQGEAEKHIAEIISVVQDGGFPNLDWDFLDLSRSQKFLDLNGECKKIAENLIMYLKKEFTPEQKAIFESGDYGHTWTETVVPEVTAI